MTSPAAAINISFNSSDCTDLDGIFLHSIVRGGPGTAAEVAGRDDAVPGAEGMFVRNRIKRNRVIELRGWVRGISTTEATDRDDYWANREDLELLFDPTVYEALTIDTGSVTYTINARPQSIDFNELVPSIAEVAIVLESVDPDWTGGGFPSS